MCGKMSEQEIGKEAARLEQVGTRSESALATQLHEMCPEDRLAVVRQIRSDMQQNPSNALPKLDFYNDGDLKSAERQGEKRVYDDDTARLTSRQVTDKDGTETYVHDPKTRTLTSYDRRNNDGSSEHSEFAPNGNRTTVDRSDKHKNKETVTFDPDSGKEVASDIKFKDGSTMHIVFDADGNIKELDSKDKDGNVNHWNRDAKDSGGTVKDEPRPYPMTGIEAKEIKFPNGFKVHLDFAPSSNYVSGIWTSDRDMKKTGDVHIASISRR